MDLSRNGTYSNMISILVDEAYDFDFLAILEIKYDYSKSQHILEKILECKEHLKKQIGSEFLNLILNSKEYKEVLNANKETFNWVDKAKTDSCKASDVDRSNYKRCKARNTLQEKFFKKKKISEVKFGYEAYGEKET